MGSASFSLFNNNLYALEVHFGGISSWIQAQAAQVQIARSYSFSYGIYANVQREKCDIFTADIYYIT